MFALRDQFGDLVNSSSHTSGQWITRLVDLSPWAGKQISTNVGVSIEANTPAGVPWDSQIADVSVVSTDGQVHAMYHGQSVSGIAWNAGAGANFSTLPISSNSAPDWYVTTTYFAGDQVGTVQEEFANDAWPVQRTEFAPFGQELSNPALSSNQLKFTGKETDAESKLDYFGARSYASSIGRFMSPDPSGLAFADPSNPQSLNLYSYAQNNPLINGDPTGLDCVYFNNAGNGIESVDHNSSSGECGSTGGDFVNGTVRSAQYFAGSDTFGFRSSDSQSNYLTYANAPGSESGGTSCAGNCDTADGFFQYSNGVQDVPLNPYAQAVFVQVGQQTAPFYNGLNTAAGCIANNTVLAPAAAVTSVLGAPVPKAIVFGRTAGMGGASSFMSGASAAEVMATGGRAAKFSGTAAKVSRAVTGTARIGGAIGRVAGPAAVVLNTALIVNCIRGQ